MRRIRLWAGGVVLAVCLACAGSGAVRRNATATIDPAVRDQAFSRALGVVQERGYVIAVSDRAAGLLTSQTMGLLDSGCGIVVCHARQTLQITIAENGAVTVQLRREAQMGSDPWFEPTDEDTVREIEADQNAILRAIVGGSVSPPQATP